MELRYKSKVFSCPSITDTMNKHLFFSLFLVSFLFAGCAKVYYSPDAKTRAMDHKVIAITPPKVSIAPNKKISMEDMLRQQDIESLTFQQEMYSWMLNRKMKYNFRLHIQDVATTNAKLEKAGYFDGTPMTPSEISALLEVDGLLMSNYSLSKPMSEGAAIATGILFGVWGPTNDATASLEIHDRETEKLIWHYQHSVNGGVGSTPTRLVDELLRNASRKMPYFQ